MSANSQPNASHTSAADIETHGGILMDCLAALGNFHDVQVSRASVLAGLPLEGGDLSPGVFSRAARRAGFTSRLVRRPLNRLNPNLLPAILLLEDNSACVVCHIDEQQGIAKIIFPELSDAVVDVALQEVQQNYTGYVIFCRPTFKFDSRARVLRKSKRAHWFWDVISQSRGVYRDILIAAVVINLLSVALPLFVMNVYDRVVPNAATDTLWVLAIGVGIALSADLALRVLRNYFVELAASRIDVTLSSDILEKVLGLNLASRPGSVGAFTNTVQSFEAVRSFFNSMTFVALVDFPFVFLFLGIVMLIDWTLTLPIILGGIIVTIYAVVTQTALKELSKTAMKTSSQRSALLVEAIAHLEDVKSFNAENKVQSSWEKSTIYMTKISAKLRLLAMSVSNTALWVQQVVGISIMLIGVYLIIEGEMTQGGLIAAYLLSGRAMGPISQAANLLSQYHHAATALNALNEIMQKPSERPAGKQWLSQGKVRGDIEFRHVYFKYPDDNRMVLHNVSFSIKAGEKVAILGRNGSGKSTINRLLLGLYQPESGSILVDGTDVRQHDPAELRHCIGYVPQDVSLFFGTLRENVNAGAWHNDDEKLLNAARIAELTNVINTHPEGFDMQVGEQGKLLSGGQRQAVAIARAVLNDPPLMLLDEPTAALDHTTEAAIKSNLQHFTRGKTLILVTHRASLLDLVDRVIVLDDNQVVADGPKESVLKGGETAP